MEIYYKWYVLNVNVHSFDVVAVLVQRERNIRRRELVFVRDMFQMLEILLNCLGHFCVIQEVLNIACLWRRFDCENWQMETNRLASSIGAAGAMV